MVYYTFVCKGRYNNQSFYTVFVFIPMTMTSPMMPAVTYVLWVRRWLRRLIRARKCLHKWIIWCQQTSMRCCMTKRDLRIRQFSFVRLLTTGSAPSPMRLRHFNLSWVSSFQFNWDQRSNQESISDQVTVISVGFQYSRGLIRRSKVCSQHMNDWQYLSLGNLEQKEFFPKSKSWGFLVP